ncbi:PTS sugar transporter subunit IIA [Brachybacterium phenoliresistens]|uniref:PTS sugar transporter subunit IIA n=1 Tax=Brachybacterium phenoliresistens TaxID=396014 RepID=Z9JQC5_9MICO|nr:PTS sugar transporter subunit IIA [Brachybacterium phenoliresistens]EWS80399.1 PTS sugar transporter subunit IIA [Brachybacterium phenoliresistens]
MSASAGDGAPEPVPSPLALLPGAAIAGCAAADAEGVLRALAARLLASGAVTGSFEEAVLAREAAYPTGLPTIVPAAIPHTDPEHVLRPGLAVATLQAPVAFGEMGSSGAEVQVQLVVMLVLADAHSQLAALQSLIARLQDEAAVREVLAARDDADLEARARAWLAG